MQMHYFVRDEKKNELPCHLDGKTQRVHSAIKNYYNDAVAIFDMASKRVYVDSYSILWLLIRYFIICFIAHLQQRSARHFALHILPQINNNVVKRKGYKE